LNTLLDYSILKSVTIQTNLEALRGVILRIKRRLAPLAIITALFISLLTGCTESTSEADMAARSLLPTHETLTGTQTGWIIFGETILIIFLIGLVILLVRLFKRYRRIEKRAIEARMRERALMEENDMLNRLYHAKTEFLQNMSHDFKTPLTVISTSILNAMDILDYEMDKEEIRESLTLAQSEVKRISRIVDIALKQTSRQSERLTKEPVDLEEFFVRVEKTYNAYLDKNGNTLVAKMPKKLPSVYCNRDTLRNVLSNLISNANRYTRNGEIIVSAELTAEEPVKEGDSRYITITVADTGMGIDPKILPDVFKRGTSTNRTGLGLPICKTAVESFGGTISIDSVYGKGTKVIFTVPVHDENKTETKGS